MNRAKAEATRLCKRLHLVILLSEYSQREVEKRAGYSSGYLSQVLYGHIELKYHHVITILEAIELTPAELFADLYPRSRTRELCDTLVASLGPHERPLGVQLAQLFGFGIEVLIDLYRRLERCEDALLELRELGFLERAKLGPSA